MFHVKHFCAALLIALLLPGVALAQVKRAVSPLAAPASNDVGDVLTRIAAKGTADIEAADSLAAAIDPDTGQMRDEIAHTCFVAMIKFIGKLPKPDSQPPGPAVIFERVRLARLTAQAGLPTYLRIGCAPLVQDETLLFVRLAAMVGVTVGTGGLAAPAIPGLAGGLLPALPVLNLLPIR
jgi:hypothetical protein